MTNINTHASTETLELMLDATRNFCQKYIAPYVQVWDEAQEIPRQIFTQLGELGLMGVLVPVKYGGTGLNYHAYASLIIEIAKVDPAVALSVAAHNSLCVGHILNWGTEVQKQKYLPDLCSAKHLGAWALTEPTSGSDAGGLKTFALRQHDEWKINGTKNFITHGNSGDIVVLIARTGKPEEKHHTTAFVIERGTQGLLKGRKESKLGVRGSETTEVITQDCIVSTEQVLGEVGKGFTQAMHILDGGRISIAALSIGLAQGAYEHALQYAKEREQFGKKIGHFQGIGFKLVDMHVEIEASKALLYESVKQKEEGKNTTKLSAMSKYYASEQAVTIATEAIQIFGGYGYMKDYPVEKLYRDAKICTIGEGTSEIQKMIIAREALKE